MHQRCEFEVITSVYEDYCLLGCEAVESGGTLTTFQGDLLQIHEVWGLVSGPTLPNRNKQNSEDSGLFPECRKPCLP